MERRTFGARRKVQSSRDATIISEISGNSGCKVFLCKDKGLDFIRKISLTSNQSLRLKEQHNKILSLKKEGMNMPEVLCSDFTDDGFFYYDMERIRGQTFATYIQSETWENIFYCFDEIILALKAVNRKKLSGVITHIDIIEKINSLKEYINIPEQVFDMLNNINEFSIDKTLNHGDATFENILITKTRKIFFIDPIDTYMQSYMGDVSKMLTEVWSGWSNINSNIELSPIVNLALEKRISMLATDFNLLKILVIVDLLRTVPYLNDDCKIDQVYKAVEKIICKKLH